MELIYIKFEKLFIFFKKFIEGADLKALLEKEGYPTKKVKNLSELLIHLKKFSLKPPKDEKEFEELFIDFLESTYNIRNLLSLLEKKVFPLNAKSLQWASQQLGISVNYLTASALIKYLRELSLVEFRNIPIYIKSVKEKIMEYILRKGRIRYQNIISKFGESVKYLLELYSEGKIEIKGIEETGLDRKKIVDISKVNLSQLNLKSRFIRLIRDTEGNMIPTIIIPKNTIIEVNLGGVK